MAERTDAKKERFGADAALRMARAASKLIASRGQSAVTFDMIRNPPGDNALLGQLLGPTGNLRAPTMRVGRVLLVGFNEAAYAKVLR